MKIGLIGKKSPALDSLLQEAGIVPCPVEQADLLLSYGGDGSFLNAVRNYPDRVVFPVRDMETAPLCGDHPVRVQFEKLRKGELKQTRLPKLVCRMGGKEILKGINDIFLHNMVPVSALRSKVWIDDELFVPELISDGAGVSTVHGATAYYRNITRGLFRTGLGLAFVNSSESTDHIVLPETSVVRFRLIRGTARLAVDNVPEMQPFAEGGECEIFLSGEYVSVLGLDIFMCPECRFLRHKKRYEFLKDTAQ